MDFKYFNFNDACNQVIKELNFQEPTKIQTKVIPLVIKGRDIIGVSQTGTGKTHAFLLPIMDGLDVENESVQAVITTPTRELAQQIYDHARLFSKYDNRIKVALVTGGIDKQKAVSKLTTQPHVVIGTPGRIRDLSLNEQALSITTAKTFVIDEADMTMEFGYLEDIDAVAGKMRSDLQMMVFSATIPQNLRPFLKKYMDSPVVVEIDEHLTTSANVKHILLNTKHKDRFTLLEEIMKVLDPYMCIIFCNRRESVSSVAKALREDGYKVGEIHGDLEPRERKQMMRRIKNMEYQYIVATDIAARGIDIDGVSHVVNLELPEESDFYIHRSGRCGRGKYTGTCISMYDSSDEENLAILERKGIEFQNQIFRNGEFLETGLRGKTQKPPETSDGTGKKGSGNCQKTAKGQTWLQEKTQIQGGTACSQRKTQHHQTGYSSPA